MPRYTVNIAVVASFFVSTLVFAGNHTLGSLISTINSSSEQSILQKSITTQEYNISLDSCDWNTMKKSCPRVRSALVSIRKRCILDDRFSMRQCEDAWMSLTNALFKKIHHQFMRQNGGRYCPFLLYTSHITWRYAAAFTAKLFARYKWLKHQRYINMATVTCPRCGFGNGFSPRQSYGAPERQSDKKFEVRPGIWYWDAELMCGKCRREFWMSRAPSISGLQPLFFLDLEEILQ